MKLKFFQREFYKYWMRLICVAQKVNSYKSARTLFITSAVCLIVSICCIGTACRTSQHRYEYAVPVETGDGWHTAALSEMGIDETLIVRLMNGLHRRQDHLIHSILIVKDGVLVFEEYFAGSDVDMFSEALIRDHSLDLAERQFSRDELHYCASVSKSVTSQLLGIALDQGRIADTDATMLSFFPEYADLGSPEKEKISVRHLLTMTTGLPFDEQTYPIADSRNDAFQLFFSRDPVAYMLSRDLVHAPGTTYQYSSGDTVLLGEIIRRTTGQSLPSFAEEHLFKPLQISSFRWAPMPEAPEIAYAAGGLYLRPRDMAKVGQLMLQEGIWDGSRVLSSDWVHQSVEQAIPVSDGSDADGYGYDWKFGRFGGVDAYWAAGWGGQYIVVLPDLSLVFVQTGGRYRGERTPISYDEIIEDYILPSMKEYRRQAETVDLTGEWSGHVILGDGSRAEICMSLAKGEDGYSGALRGNGNAIPEMKLRDIIFKLNRLTFEFDFPGARGTELITVDLRYWHDTLDGSYTDPTGDSDRLIVQRER